MNAEQNQIGDLATQEYKYGFVSDIESDTVAPGLSEDVIRMISAKKMEPEWLLEWRLKVYRHWKTMTEPHWPNVKFAPIDYQAIAYYSAPKQKIRPKSLTEVDPELVKTYEKLGIPLKEQEWLAGVAVDAVFDSVSVATTFKEKLKDLGIIFCSFSEAVREHPDLIKKYLGSVVPQNDNFFAALNSAVFTDGSFCLYSGRRPLSHGAFHVFPHQCRRYGSVRTYLDRCGGRGIRQLSGRMHGSHAGHEPIACGSRRDCFACKCAG